MNNAADGCLLEILAVVIGVIIAGCIVIVRGY